MAFLQSRRPRPQHLHSDSTTQPPHHYHGGKATSPPATSPATSPAIPPLPWRKGQPGADDGNTADGQPADTEDELTQERPTSASLPPPPAPARPSADLTTNQWISSAKGKIHMVAGTGGIPIPREVYLQELAGWSSGSKACQISVACWSFASKKMSSWVPGGSMLP